MELKKKKVLHFITTIFLLVIVLTLIYLLGPGDEEFILPLILFIFLFLIDAMYLINLFLPIFFSKLKEIFHFSWKKLVLTILLAFVFVFISPCDYQSFLGTTTLCGITQYFWLLLAFGHVMTDTWIYYFGIFDVAHYHLLIITINLIFSYLLISLIDYYLIKRLKNQ